MKNNSLYMDLVHKSRKKHLQLTLDNYKYIRNLYKDAAKDLEAMAKTARKDSLNERWIRDYQKTINEEIKILNKIISTKVREDMGSSAQNATYVQLDFFHGIGLRYGFNSDESFNPIFSSTPTNVIKELVAGEFYKDNKSLNERIWSNSNKTKKDIDYIIQKGILLKKSSYELAKDLQVYINPEEEKPWPWKKVYPGAGNKTIDYNAQRLARTAINHAYFLANIRSCSKNPFVEGIHWELSTSHYIRQVEKWGEDICDEYANQNNYKLGRGNFPIEEVPVPHPQCLCSQWAFIPKSLDEIGTELRRWLDGESNFKLDNWYMKYGLEFAS